MQVMPCAHVITVMTLTSINSFIGWNDEDPLSIRDLMKVSDRDRNVNKKLVLVVFLVKFIFKL